MKFIGLENYMRMFQDETFRQAVINNLKFVVMGSLFQLCVGLILAILLTHISKGGNVLRVIYFIPCIISSMAICQNFFQNAFCPAAGAGLLCDGKIGNGTDCSVGKFSYSTDNYNFD